MATYNQSIFSKLNRRKEPTQLVQGEYALLINGRVRNGGVEPVQLPTNIASLPPGRIQGIYGYDKYLLVFVEGKAYFRDYSISTDIFYQVTGFQMSADAPVIYACAVPASTVNRKRIPTSTDDGTIVTSSPVSLTTAIGSSPACVLCQDGVTQPFVIFTDGTARETGAYTDWESEGEREYVPVGKQMFYSADGILYLVAQDPAGNYTYILHSVSGRPLDFMVIVDADGEKLPTEAEGGAQNVAYSVDYAEVTAISGIGANDGAFLVATFKQSYMVIPDFSRLIYGEPKFRNQPLFSTGPLNNFSLVDLLGDQALIDFTGIKSFNSILQTRNEGKNTPFSADIQPLFGNIIQTVTAATEFDDYGLFGVNTKYGPAILVWDSILPLPAFVSMDLYPNVANVKQFATIKTLARRTVFFITEDNKLYEAFSGPTSSARLYVGEFAASNTSCAIKPELLSLNFVDVVESGTVYATSFLDSAKQNQLSEQVTQIDLVEAEVLIEPFGDNNVDRVRTPSFDLNTLQASFKVGFYIEWNFKAKLLSATFTAADVLDINSHKEQAREYNSTKTFLEAAPVVPVVPPRSYGPLLPTLTPLNAPSNLRAVLIGSGVQLDWTLNSTSHTQVNVYRTLTSSINYALLTTLSADATEYLDDQVTEGSAYYYVVTVSNVNIASSYSNEASALTYPLASSGLAVGLVTSATELSLSWQNNSASIASLQLMRAVTPSGPFSLVANLAANINSYTDTGLIANTQYYYQVVVTGLNGLTANSNVANGLTWPTAPVTPVLLTATSLSESSVGLTWSISESTGLGNFKVYRSLVSGSGYSLIAIVGAGVTYYTDTGLAAFTDYYYVIVASNVSGDSANSNELGAKTWSSILTFPSVLSFLSLKFNGGANIAAGNYQVVYVRGAYRGVASTWNVQQGGASGFVISYNSGTSPVLKAPGNLTQYPSQLAAEVGNNANTGLTLSPIFVHTGGTIGVYYTDTSYSDNANGTPNPQFQLIKVP